MRANSLMAAAFAVVASFGATVWADQSHSEANPAAPCTVVGHRIVSVKPDVQENQNGKRTSSLLGADIRILAEPGMTAEYLTVEVDRHVAAMHGAGMPNCVFDVPGANIEVRSAGDSFVFRVTSEDDATAREILRRARVLG